MMSVDQKNLISLHILLFYLKITYQLFYLLVYKYIYIIVVKLTTFKYNILDKEKSLTLGMEASQTIEQIERRYPTLKDDFKELIKLLRIALLCLLICLIGLLMR